MFLVAFRGRPEVARQWEASCRAAAAARGQMLQTATLPLPQDTVLSVGWIARNPVDLATALGREGAIVRTPPMRPDGARLTADLESGTVSVTAAPVSPEQIHYAQRGGGLFISNDCRLLLRFLGFDLDPAAVFAILQIGAVPAPLSTGRGIAKLAPGRTVTFGADGGETLSRFEWRPPGKAIDEASAEEEIRSRLATALPARGDGPVTLFFSGGVDSAVLAEQLRRGGHDAVTLVNYAFAPNDPEAAIAREMADHFRFPFVQLFPEKHAIEDVLSRAGEEYTYPFGDVSTLPTNAMIHAALGHVAPGGVVIEGTGADGIMGLGSALAVWQRFAAAPGIVDRLGAAGYRILGMWRYGGRIRKVCWVLRTLSQMPLLEAAVLSQNSLEGIAYRVPESERNRIAAAIETAYGEPTAGLAFDVRASMIDLMHVCGGIFAAKSFDPLRSAGMRMLYPFLSPRLTELSALLAPECKYRGGVDKPVLKGMLRASLPAHFVDRQKRGFEPPMARYLRIPAFRSYLLDEVMSAGNPVADHVDRKRTRKMIEYSGRHALANREVHNYLWAITFLTAWVRAQKSAAAGVFSASA